MEKIKLVIEMKTKKPFPYYPQIEDDEEEDPLERIKRDLRPLQYSLRRQLFLDLRKYLNGPGPWNLWYQDLGGEIVISEFKVLKIYEKKN